MSFNWLTRSTASQAQLFLWKISKSANALFRFPTTSGWRLPEKTLRFLTYTGKSRSSLVNFSQFQRHHYRSLNDTSCTFPWNLDASPLFSPFCLSFPLRNDHFRAHRISAVWHFSSFTQLHTETTLHPAPPLFFLWTLTPGCICAFNCCIHFSLRLPYCFCRFLCLLFCACSCTAFFCVSVLAKLSTPIFPWGGILI